MQLLLFAALAAVAITATGRVLVEGPSKPNGLKDVVQNRANVSAVPASDSDRLKALQKSLESIRKLRTVFAKESAEPIHGAEKFAVGAMSAELASPDSAVWSTIESMLGSVETADKKMKGMHKEEQQTMMASLESELDSKAGSLTRVTQDVSAKQQQQNEEYLLGLLMMHEHDWSMQRQLNATATFMGGSLVVKDVFEHHNASVPLARQLAAKMDAAARQRRNGLGGSGGNASAINVSVVGRAGGRGGSNSTSAFALRGTTGSAAPTIGKFLIQLVSKTLRV
jgi:hypothetical protein